MIGTIRKHSNVLWWTIVPLTIVSFVFFMSSTGMRNGNGGSGSNLGTLYGKPVTEEAFDQAKAEFYIFYLLRNQQWPDRLSSTELELRTYERLMLTAKARELGIHVSEDAQVTRANEFLRQFGRDNGPVPMSVFDEKVLQPEHLTVADFQRFVASDLAIDQLIQSLGLPEALVPPQQAAQIYDHENQEVSAQAVFFSLTNYLSQVTADPATVQQFYNNEMAIYRVPDRVQLNYLEYDLTNFMAAAEEKAGKTNITALAESYYSQHGAEAVPEAKTPEEAKAKIREMILRQGAQGIEGAAGMAAEKAKDFLKELFQMEPTVGANLVTLAKKYGITVHTTAPFSEADGPAEFPASADLTKLFFKLNAETPFVEKPVTGPDAVYIIGLAGQLPSAVPAFSEIHDRVVQDYKNYEAAAKARTAGTNFYYNARVQMAVGKSFAAAATAGGVTPVALEPFSLNTQTMPDVEGHADLSEFKMTAFTTQPGQISQFLPTAEGGFVIYVQSLLPVDERAKTTALPRYLAQMRRARQNEGFNLWLQVEENRELKNTPVYDELIGRKPASSSP